MSLSVRFIKICMVATIGLFFSIVAFNNIIDFKSNLPFVQHVLSMDTTFREAHLMQRAITNPITQTYAYYVIIGWEIFAALLCWVGSLKLFVNIKETPAFFNMAKKTAFFGLFLGFLLYMVGFIIVGGEWFSMWQSQHWNGQMKAGLFLSLILFIMLFLQQNEGT